MDFVISSYLLACLLDAGRVLERSAPYVPALLLGPLQGVCFWQAGIPGFTLAAFNTRCAVQFVCCAVSFRLHQYILGNKAVQPHKDARCPRDF